MEVVLDASVAVEALTATDAPGHARLTRAPSLPCVVELVG